VGAVLPKRALLQTPYSNNPLNPQLSRTTPQNWSYVPGVNPLAVDPNCGCFSPRLNPKAWTDEGPEHSEESARFSNNRWQRRPAEAMSFGRNSRIGMQNTIVCPRGAPEHLRPALPPYAADGDCESGRQATTRDAVPALSAAVYTSGYG
jgi:hypothetical protein